MGFSILVMSDSDAETAQRGSHHFGSLDEVESYGSSVDGSSGEWKQPLRHNRDGWLGEEMLEEPKEKEGLGITVDSVEFSQFSFSRCITLFWICFPNSLEIVPPNCFGFCASLCEVVFERSSVVYRVEIDTHELPVCYQRARRREFAGPSFYDRRRSIYSIATTST
jgi:hypothetical protein